MKRLLALVAIVAALVAVPGPPASAAPDGTLTLASTTVKAGDPIQITYSTPRPDAANWLGLYTDPGNGPVNQEYVGPSLKWVYAGKGDGTATLPTTGLSAGPHIVYFLAKDGYEWLAQPVKLTITDGSALRFVTGSVPLRNARAGAAYQATIGGLARGGRPGYTFRKVSGAAWVTVAADGRVGGTPPANSGAVTDQITAEVTDTAGKRATTGVRVPVRPTGTAYVPTLKVLSFNLWHGGSRVTNGREKQLRFLLDQNVDAVGLQEQSSTSARELATALGWDYFDGGYSLGIISRYPIAARGAHPSQSGLAGLNARIRVDDTGDRQISLWNMHLGYNPYGPYDMCFGKMNEQQLLAREEQSGRTPQIKNILKAMAGDIANRETTPVLLTGDTNAPSHRDYTAATASRHCGYASFPWPTSVLPEQAGLVDSYRVAHPDPARHPGDTWSPIFPTFTGGYGYDSHKGEPEPQDRIDVVRYAGNLTVTSSTALVTGTPRPDPDHENNEWTSDHRAVLTTFRLT
ncbi:endonuclease/exonuclease/phosphatase family protein [Spirillospora sp. CA-294931]|uniref:endonuclease/exonuclease/phosphatase family protein n=1 Tax=Spirillospora sp. CA-294931 TaxID=3240042 RepID=UPI003D8D27E4